MSRAGIPRSLSSDAGDRVSAKGFQRIVDGCDTELADRQLSILTRAVMNESQQAGKQAAALLAQAING